MLNDSKLGLLLGGNFQTYGAEFFETYSPVVSFIVVRIFLTVAVKRRMKKKVVDVKTAFLNGMLKIDIRVMSPRGIPNKPFRCQKLSKAIYGLKQSHLAWHKRLCSDLKNTV